MPSNTVLIANRGEIAVRVIRTCRELGIGTVSIYSDADRDSLHVEMADRSYRVGPATPAESYLNVAAILDAAARGGATHVHPGYGFLAENPDFARACADAGLVFIGPPPEAMEMMGDKAAARRAAEEVGVPVIPGVSQPVGLDEARGIAERIGYPMAVKAAFGGGGRGMHLIESEDELEESLQRSAREAKAYFGRAEVYLERYIPRAHHVEAQILADAHGNLSFLGERDCTLQRRYQKLLEESPSPVVSPDLRNRIGEAALAIAKRAGYTNAGTVEFLVDDDGAFYFLEVNARLQVEHPVTEMVTGLDLVALQLAIADGQKVDLAPDLRGHAIECRINAEDPSADFLPGPGLLTRFRPPGGPFVRLDAGFTEGRTIPGDYDSLFAKLIVWGEDREVARRRMLRAFDEMEVEGVPTTIPFYRWAIETLTFREASHTTKWVERALAEGQFQPPEPAETPARPVGAREAQVVVELEGRRVPVRVWGEELPTPPKPPASATGGAHAHGADALVAPMQGTILQVLVDDGQEVKAGESVCVLEAMKMENHIAAARDGVVKRVAVSPGDVVDSGQVLVEFGQ
ncbi:MAG TPA: biotin carboxylase N-terminal domain-containing protein [Actinomycetota bacterium]|nr:biotin carboxylase N-terminal domain-containing protein [Actinomycetota bacterium]